MGAPIFNLVREDLVGDTIHDLDLVAGSDPTFKRDEIRLVDTDGVGSAFPALPAAEDLDFVYKHVHGARSRMARARLRHLAFDIDWIDSGPHTRLEQWIDERARVMVAPGFGANSVCAMRPLTGMTSTNFRDGTTPAVDLTGRNTMFAPGSDSLSYWDRRQGGGVMLGPWTSSPVIPTPGGAGLLTQRSYTNRMVPSSPESATPGPGAGNAGWAAWGSGSGDVSFSLVTNGFGHPDFPHSLRVTVNNNVSASRALGIQGLWDPGSGEYGGWTPSGTGSFLFGFWIRGRVGGNDVRAILSAVGQGDLDVVDLAGMEFDDWTPIWLEGHRDWTGIIPSVTIKLEAETTGDYSKFELGPAIAVQYQNINYNRGSMMAPSTAGSSGGGDMAAFSVPFPPAGTLFASWYTPAEMVDAANALAGIAGGGTPLYLQAQVASGTHYLKVGYGANTATVDIGQHVEGLHSAAFVYGPMWKGLYYDGRLIWSSTDAAAQSMSDGNSFTFILGASAYGSVAAAPLIPLGVRLDRNMMDATEVMGNHLLHTDTAALATVLAARGRTYEIVDIPRTARPAARGTHWLGKLKLKQVDYDHNLADITTQEVQ